MFESGSRPAVAPVPISSLLTVLVFESSEEKWVAIHRTKTYSRVYLNAACIQFRSALSFVVGRAPAEE